MRSNDVRMTRVNNNYAMYHEAGITREEILDQAVRVRAGVAGPS